MWAAALKSLLAKGPPLADRLAEAIALCGEWFEADPRLVPYIFRAVFVDLDRRDWGDPQGVRVVELAPFQSGVLPLINAMLDTFVAGQSDPPPGSVETLLIAVRDAHSTIQPVVAPVP